MKTLGLLGGMSWESTTSYYQHMNRLARERLGGQHSARLIVWSLDFAPIAAMQAAGDWAAATDVLIDAARRLEGAGAEAVMICANTMHLMAGEVQEAIRVPLLSVVDATAAAIRASASRRPVLLATRFTMEKAFYRDGLSAHGVSAVLPTKAERERLHAIIFDELVRGRLEPGSRLEVIEMARRAMLAEGADGVILGCTEFALLVQPTDFAAPVFDTTEIHARMGMDFAMG
jgi:aspartate racemase